MLLGGIWWITYVFVQVKLFNWSAGVLTYTLSTVVLIYLNIYCLALIQRIIMLTTQRIWMLMWCSFGDTKCSWHRLIFGGGRFSVTLLDGGRHHVISALTLGSAEGWASFFFKLLFVVVGLSIWNVPWVWRESVDGIVVVSFITYIVLLTLSCRKKPWCQFIILLDTRTILRNKVILVYNHRFLELLNGQ